MEQQTLKQIYFDDIEVGMTLPTLTKQPTKQQLVMYAGASGDFYPIHYDLEFARSVGLDEVILHGALKSAFLGQLVLEWMGEAGKLKKLSVQYRKMDPADKPMYCKGVVSRKYVEMKEHLVECQIWAENGDGEKTTPGSALIDLPTRQQ